MIRSLLPAALLALAALLPGCADEPSPARPEPRVKLAVTIPDDGATVRERLIALEGTVAPAGATVQVRGEDVAVQGGTFRAEVELEPGMNLVDVAATAADRRPAFATTRIVLEERVAVPDVVGDDADAAREQLEGLGFEVATEQGGGFLDPILPGDPSVCAAEPAAGTEALPGSRVVLVIAREC